MTDILESFAVIGKSDAELAAGARAAGLALSAGELRRIAERLGRDPTMVEAFAFDAQWSEHCSYKSSRSFLGRLPTEGDGVVLGVGEDAGIVRLGTWNGEAYGVVIAHESHNHPSQVVPFEGAATGVGGIVRDVLCMGARVIGLADALRFGPLDDPHCRYVAQGVVDGIAAYGNAIGVPNLAGDVYFEEGFRDNCLVNVVALGLVKDAEIVRSRGPADADGWDIVLVGKATDRSGFGGAAFSSLVLDEDDAEANKGAVQVPDPFLKNVLMRATYRAFDVVRAENVSVGFKDLGAGGIMGCTAELVAAGGFGATIDLDRCPTSQANLPAAVIAVGETQERLAWVVPPHFTSRLLSIYNDEYGLPEVAAGARAAIIGTVTQTQDYVLRRAGDEVMRVPIDFLTAGVRYQRPYEPRGVDVEATPGAERVARDAWSALGSLDAALRAVLAHRDVCSRRTIYERYDAVVRGTTSIPRGAADAGVIVPIPGAPLAVALSVAGNPRYGAIDPRRAGELAVLEAVRDVLAVGATPVALTDCLNFGNPEDPRQFGQFVDAVDGLAHAARELRIPFVSGNVSLYNQAAAGNAIPASPIVACVGTMQDVSRAVTRTLKRPGSALYRFGGVTTDRLGGTVFADLAGLAPPAALPPVSYAALWMQMPVMRAAIERGLLLAAAGIGDGGILVCLARMAFPTLAVTPLGAVLDGALGPWAFAESGGLVFEVADDAAFRALCTDGGLRDDGVALYDPSSRPPIAEGERGRGSFARLGTTIGEPSLRGAGETLDLRALHETWLAPLAGFYEDAP
jgi:phosphoribosylformylglycinamidine synthase